MNAEAGITYSESLPDGFMKIADNGLSTVTDKAVQIKLPNGYSDDRFVWAPKSVLLWSHNGGPEHFHAALYIKKWFVAKNDLWDWVS